ncbi:MAG: hypothetical protein OYG32_15715 [Rhodospirillaceae bacterium]|nr:hypothetical protein [Rhodospirillaceae bacterium]MDE0619864.1 hypothetical protein [Rhodospirillaceae bacterium]
MRKFAKSVASTRRTDGRQLGSTANGTLTFTQTLSAFRCLSPPRAVLILKKSAFDLMTDPVFPTARRPIQRNLFNERSALHDIRPKFFKLDPGLRSE